MSDENPAILFVDDEENILNAFRRIFRKEPYRVFTASTAAEGMNVIREEAPMVVISDQRMPDIDGTAFLKQIKEAYPHIIRIILTGYTDVDTIREAVNHGHIYKFLLKPWNDENLILEIRQAVKQFELEAVNRELNQKVMAQNEALRHLNDHLENLVQDRTEELIIRNKALELAQAILSDLPVPILGVGADGIIAMTNHTFERGEMKHLRFEVGKSIEECFPPEVVDIFQQGLKSTRMLAIESLPIGNMAYRIECIPLSGSYAGQGVVIAFLKSGQSNSAYMPGL